MKNNLQNTDTQQDIEIESELSAIDFTTIGIACHALCLIEQAGVLKELLKGQPLKETRLNKFKNPALIKSALVTLVGAKVLQFRDKCYTLSHLGKSIAKEIGLITLPLIGYRKLFCKQLDLLRNPSKINSSDIDFSQVALASIDFGANHLDPLIIDIFRAIKPRGTICDLGCGTGEKLVKICTATNCPGLGIEKNRSVINKSKKYTKGLPNIEIVRGDLAELKDVWEDVDIAMVSFVFHDITSLHKCNKVLRSFHSSFPRMRCLIVVDIVAPSEKVPTIMPGFDYVHGLQGILPRSYEETLEMFKNAHYTVFQETPVPNMPNTFIWILKPTGHQKSK